MNRNAPDRHVAVDVYGDNRMLATVEATWNRPDVRAAGFGTGQYGFYAAVPSELRDGRPHVIGARIAGSTWELTGSPKAIRCGPAPSQR
jgi:hypothetical protein